MDLDEIGKLAATLAKDICKDYGIQETFFSLQMKSGEAPLLHVLDNKSGRYLIIDIQKEVELRGDEVRAQCLGIKPIDKITNKDQEILKELGISG